MKIKAMILVLLLISACKPDSRATPMRSSAADLVDSDWILVSMNGQPVLAGSNLTLKFDSAGLGGYSGCNWYGTHYSAQGSAINVEQIGGTARACAVPDGVMQQEQNLYRTLERVKSFAMRRDSLQLRDSVNAVLLQFKRRERVAMNPQDLIGTRWALAVVNGAAFESKPPVTLAFSATGTSGFAGCRDYTGTYHAKSDELRFTSIEMLAMACNRGLVIQRREEQFTTYLSETSHYRQSADSLVLFTFPGDRIAFHRAH